MTDKRTPIVSILDKVIGSVEISKDNPSHYAIKDKEGNILLYAEASFAFDKNWNWFDDTMIKEENDEVINDESAD